MRSKSRHHQSLSLITWTRSLILLVGCIVVSSEAFLQQTFCWAATSSPSIGSHHHAPLNVVHIPDTAMPPTEVSEDDELSRKVLQLNVPENVSTTKPPAKGIAVILNSNARGVSKAMIKAIQDLASQHEDMRVYATSNAEQAQQAVEDLQANKPKMVVPIGGDGTLTTMIQMLYDNLEADEELPHIGYIAMGTGNALGTVIGCNPKRRFRKKKRLQAIQDVLTQLLEISQQMENDDNIQDQVDIVDVPLMHVTTTGAASIKQQVYCFFAGIGFDSLMLQDYKELQEWSSRSRIWKDKFASVWGYTVALFTRTLPKCVAHQSHLVQLQVSTNEPALWVDHRRGDVVRKVHLNSKDTSTLLYKGQAGIVAASTTPFYGGNLKLFPFARLSENGCQVRIGRIHPLTGVVNIPQIFSGAYRNSEMGCLDFIGTQFTVEIENEGHPVQHSGESMGLAQKVELEVLKEPVRFVTLLPPRLVCEE